MDSILSFKLNFINNTAGSKIPPCCKTVFNKKIKKIGQKLILICDS